MDKKIINLILAYCDETSSDLYGTPNDPLNMKIIHTENGESYIKPREEIICSMEKEYEQVNNEEELYLLLINYIRKPHLKES